VRRDQELYLAEILRTHREQLERTVAEISERRRPLTPLEARLFIDQAKGAVDLVEGALRRSAAMHRLRRPRLIAARLRSWTKPRIGRLRHYQPKPLRVPHSYLDTRLPEHVPTISIVTPSYGQGRFIERTLYSVISQDYPALEYVVQDGGSTDSTVEILRRYEHALTEWISEEDEGQADAINRGFTRTTGEIMGWLNSDDLLLPGSLAYVARYFVEHPQVDVVYGHRLMIDENDGQIGAWVLPSHDERALMLADYIPQETLFWRRRTWDAAGGRVDQDFAYALDWELLLRFQEIGAKMVRLPRFIGAFRVHDEQQTTVAEALGSTECARLRQRVHGYTPAIEDVLKGLRPYFLRHILIHTRVRAGDRLLPRRLVHVRTLAAPPRHSAHASDATMAHAGDATLAPSARANEAQPADKVVANGQEHRDPAGSVAPTSGPTKGSGL
jgi:glycosyltransferase involved in cell wall biosynthesis